MAEVVTDLLCLQCEKISMGPAVPKEFQSKLKASLEQPFPLHNWGYKKSADVDLKVPLSLPLTSTPQKNAR